MNKEKFIVTKTSLFEKAVWYIKLHDLNLMGTVRWSYVYRDEKRLGARDHFQHPQLHLTCNLSFHLQLLMAVSD